MKTLLVNFATQKVISTASDKKINELIAAGYVIVGKVEGFNTKVVIKDQYAK